MLKIGDRLLSLADFKHRPKTPQPQKTGHGRRWKNRQRTAEQSRRKTERLASRVPRPPMVRRNGLPFCVFGIEPPFCNRGPISIYALVDPRDNTVRYVGKTSSPRDRLAQHIEWESKGRKGKWVAELKAAGAVPRMEILERVPVGEWEEAERKWIAFYSARGSVLNVEIGGRSYHHGSARHRTSEGGYSIRVGHVDPSRDKRPTAGREEIRGWVEFLMGS